MRCENCRQPVTVSRRLDGSWGAFLALLPVWLLLLGLLYLLLPGDADLWFKRGTLILVLGLILLIVAIPAWLIRVRIVQQYQCGHCGHSAGNTPEQIVEDDENP